MLNYYCPDVHKGTPLIYATTNQFCEMLRGCPLLKSLCHGWHCILYYIAKVSDGLICQPGTKILHLSCTNADVLSCLSTKTKTFYLGFANFTSTFWGQNLDKIAFEFLNLTKKNYLTFDEFDST